MFKENDDEISRLINNLKKPKYNCFFSKEQFTYDKNKPNEFKNLLKNLVEKTNEKEI